MWTPLASLCLASLLFPAQPNAVETSSEQESVFAWVLGDTGFESSRFAPLLVIEDSDGATIETRFASMPAGRRGLATRSLLTTLSQDPSDHVVVAGHITDHSGPWLDGGISAATEELSALAKRLAASSQSVDLLLVEGESPISAAVLDTPDDLVWIAIRNDSRFDDVRPGSLTLQGAMTPSSDQWDLWNEFADATLAQAVERSAEGLRKASPDMVVVSAPAGDGPATGSWSMELGVRSTTAGFAATSFDELRDQIESAVTRRSGGTAVLPRVIPFSHPGSSERRSFVVGTSMWDELVRHAILIGDGAVLYVEDRGTADPQDGVRFDGILEQTAAEEWAGAFFASARSSWESRSGSGFFATGVGAADGEMVWRITFAPGFTQLAVSVDGDSIIVRRDAGQSGGWLVHDAAVTSEFPEFATRDEGEFAGPAATGGGLVPGGKRTSGPTLRTADSSSPNDGASFGVDPSDAAFADGGLGFTNQDLNGDGVIDGADQAIWLSGGAEAEWTDYGFEEDDYSGTDPRMNGGDLNGDGFVDGADLAIRLAGDGGFGTAPANVSTSPSRGSRSKPKLRLRQRNFTSVDADGGVSDGGWTGTAYGDLDGNGVIDGADLAIHLSSQTGNAAPGGDPAGGGSDGGDPDAADADSTGSDGDDAGESETGTTPDGTPPSVDPTIPIGDGGDGEPTPPNQNSTVTVLYDGLPSDTVGAGLQADGIEQYLIVYEAVDPDARTTGQIDADRVVQHIRTKHGDSPSGYGILDFENPFFERISAGPSDPHYQSTVNTIVALLDRVRAEFPNVKWTMYGMPRIKYWGPPGSYGWATADDPDREELLEAALEAFTPVLERCDWMNPSVYDRYELERQNQPSWQMWTDRETSWREYTVELCRRFNEGHAGPDKPIIPMVSPLFFKVGQIEYNMKYMTAEELLRDQVRPVMEAGADGIAFWTGFNYWTHAVTSSDDLGVLQQEARVAMANDFLDDAPEVWVDDSIRSELEARVSERVGETVQIGRLEAQSILATRLAGVPDS